MPSVHPLLIFPRICDTIITEENERPAEESMREKITELTDEEMREVRLAREEIYDGVVIHLTKDTVRVPGGAQSIREVAWHRGAVCIIPVTDRGEVVLVEQYRYPYDTVLLEIPAGKLEIGETDTEAAARRELTEETGYTAQRMIPFGEYYGSPAILKEKIAVYLALGLTPGETHFDEDEYLRVRHVPMADAVRMAVDGEIPDGKTQAAILRAHLYLSQNGGENR